MPAAPRVVGQTKDAGFEIGARKTISATPEAVWSLLTSPQGLRLWLGDIASLKLERGQPYQTLDGTQGEIRVVNPGSHIRLTWQPAGWQQSSTLQVRVIPGRAKTVISFHQERLAGPAEREAMRERWQAVLDELEIQLESNGAYLADPAWSMLGTMITGAW